MIDIQLLGQFKLSVAGTAVLLPSRPAQSLLAQLALSPGIAHRREKLAGELWPAAREANARSNLRHALWRIRRALERSTEHTGRELIETDHINISLSCAAEARVDALRVLRSAADGRATTADLVAAAGLYHGELLPGFYEEWVSSERMRVQSAFDALMQRLIAQLSEEQRWREIVHWGTHWFVHGESIESACRAVMFAQHTLGNANGVHAAFRQCGQRLMRDLDAAPSADTLALFDHLLHAPPPRPVDASSLILPDARARVLALLDERHWQMQHLMHSGGWATPM